MDDQDWLAQRFEEHRARLRGVAYRMLGSLSEADDAVQEAWLRLSRTDASEVENLGGWLTTVVARVCLNMLRSRRDPARGAARRARARCDRRPRRRRRSRARGAAGRLGRPGAAGRARDPGARRAARLRAARHVRRPFDEIAPIVDRSPAAPASSPAAPAAAFRASAPAPTPTRPASARWSTPSSPPPARATSRRSSPCSTPTSCSAPTWARCRAPSSGSRGRGLASQPRSTRGSTRRLPVLVNGAGARSHARRSPVLGRRGHGPRRQDRRAGLPGRPRAPPPARPDRRGRVRSQGARRRSRC